MVGVVILDQNGNVLEAIPLRPAFWTCRTV
jgi:hypothetical protein